MRRHLPILLLALLAGCYYPFPSEISYYIRNDYPAQEDYICFGGLRGRLTSGDALIFDSPTVAFGEERLEIVPISPGLEGRPARLEAWCHGAGGEELSYIAVDGRFVSGEDSDVRFGSPLPSPPARCAAGAVVRGVPPCVWGGIVRP